MKKIMFLGILVMFPSLVNAQNYYSEECDILLSENQQKMAMALEMKENISEVSCKTLEEASWYIDNTITILQKEVQYSDESNSRATCTLYDINYSFVVALNSQDNKYHGIAIVYHPTKASITAQSQGKWNFVGTSWSTPSITPVSVTQELYASYTKGGTVYTNSNVRGNVPVSMLPNSHNLDLTAFVLPTGTNVTISVFRSDSTFPSQPANACMGHYFLKKSATTSLNPSLQQFYSLQNGFFLYNNSESLTNRDFYYTTLCA